MTDTVLIENGTLLDGTGAAPRPEAILIDDGVIAELGNDAVRRAHNLPNVSRIDATGLTVMPGLIDAHCHLTFDEPASNDELFFHRRHALSVLIAARNLKKLLRAGVTSCVDPDQLFEMGVDLRDGIETGVIEGPRLKVGAYAMLTQVGATAGRLIPDHGIIGYGKVLNNKDEIIAEVRRQIKMGVDWIKVHNTGLIPRQKERGELQVWTFEELKLVCDIAHDLGVPVMGHCRGARSTRDAARAGFDMILHATLMDEEALEAVVERKVPLVPTFTFQANLIDYGDAVGAGDYLRDIFRREISDSAETLMRAYRAGVPLLCGSESGFSVTPYGEWHHREIEVFVRDLGMSPLEAIQCGTQAGAIAMRMEGKVGEISKGCVADVIGVAGDPSKDVTVLGNHDNIRFVMLDGKLKDVTDRDPPRLPISGWRVNDYGHILTQAYARH
jgi:imidazolonepropionase-like amidohydrolase